MHVIELKDGELLAIKDLELVTETKADDEGNIVAIVSTETEDSDMAIIRQRRNKKGAGWILDHFNKGPVLTWMHDMFRPNIGAPGTKAKLAKDEKLGSVLTLNPAKFDQGDEVAVGIEGKLRRGVLNEWSVGFRGRVWERREADENGRQRGYEFFEQKLAETAVVNRGANYDTSTAIKSLLAYEGGDVEDGGSAEIMELRSEVEFLNERLVTLEGIVARSASPQRVSC